MVPGDEVTIFGLQGKPELNGEHGVVEPLASWPSNGRVAVRLQSTKRAVSVKADNLKFLGPACFIDPGDEVTIFGLQGKPELNGEHGVVEPLASWPSNGRVAVRLQSTKRAFSIKADNLKLLGPTCFICLERDREYLVGMGCGCRGSAGWVHESCALKAAAAQQETQSLQFV